MEHLSDTQKLAVCLILLQLKLETVAYQTAVTSAALCWNVGCPHDGMVTDTHNPINLALFTTE